MPLWSGPAPNTLTAEEKRGGWTLLFDGTSMKGWVDPRRQNPAGDAWSIEDGCLKAKSKPRITEDLFSVPTFGDFELAFEWRIAAVGAGVVFGVLANSSQSNFKQAATLADKDTFAAQTRQNALFADIGYGVGLAAIVTAVVLYPKGSDADAPVAFWLGPASVGLKGSF